MKIEVLRAWPRRFERLALDLPPGARVVDALRAAGVADDPEITGYAVFGAMVDGATRLQDGDRVELLRDLLADPKDARRRRAQRSKR